MKNNMTAAIVTYIKCYFGKGNEKMPDIKMVLLFQYTPYTDMFIFSFDVNKIYNLLTLSTSDYFNLYSDTPRNHAMYIFYPIDKKQSYIIHKLFQLGIHHRYVYWREIELKNKKPELYKHTA